MMGFDVFERAPRDGRAALLLLHAPYALANCETRSD